jgi:hypothetical protein
MHDREGSLAERFLAAIGFRFEVALRESKPGRRQIRLIFHP